MQPLLPQPGPLAVTTTPASSVPPAPKTLTACNECRQKKAKCDGARPLCGRCNRSRTTCVYASDSIVAQNALKRKYKELQQSTDLHAEFINFLRTREQHDAIAILQRLRKGDTVESLVKFIKYGDLLLGVRLPITTQPRYSFPMLPPLQLPSCLKDDQNPFARSFLDQTTFCDEERSMLAADSEISSIPAHDKKYKWPYHAAELIEPTIDKVCAAQWTSVTDSDALVRALLKSYLYHDYPNVTLFEKGAFLVDLVAGQKAYCSSLLVNAILACACQSHRMPGNSADFWKPGELRYRFLSESRRLWEREQSHNHIVNVQAAAIICYVLSCDGVDKVGFRYLQRSMHMADDMHIFEEYKTAVDSKKKTVYLTTAWGLHSLHVIQTFLTRQAPIFEMPLSFLLDVPSHDFHPGEVWVLYPQAPQPVPLQHSLVFSTLCRLMVIMHDLVVRSYGSGKRNGPVTLNEAMQYRERLLAWEASQPTALQPGQIVHPTHIKIHMQYYGLNVFIFDRFNEENHTMPQLYRHQEILHTQTIAAAAWRRLESLIYVYYARHGFEAYDPLLTNCLQLVGFAALEDLAIATGPERVSRLATVLLCAKGLRDQANHYYLAEVIFALLRDSLTTTDAQQLRQFACIENEERRKHYMVEHVFSNYVLGNTSSHSERQSGRLDEVLRISST